MPAGTTPSPPPTSPPPPSLLWPAVLVVCVTLAAFSRVLVNDFVNWDDKIAIQHNPSFTPPTAKSLKYYWTDMDPHNEFFVPVNYTTWWLLAHLAPATDAAGKSTVKPWPFHTMNLLAHAANGLLVLLVLHRLTRSRWPACLGALLFALHPLQAEPVAWASSMYSELSGFFALLALWQYLKYSDLRYGDASDAPPAPAPGTRPKRRPGYWRPYLIATVAFALALLTKPVAVVVPGIVAVIELFLRRRRVRDLLLPLGAWGVLALPTIILARASQQEPAVYIPTPLWRFLVALDALAFYLYKLVVPVGLAPDYGRSPRWLLHEGPVLYTWMAPVALGIVAWAVRDKARWMLACLLLFVVALLPTLGLVPFDYQRYSTVADRYAYLAMLAPALALAWVLSRYPRPVLMVLVGLVLAGLGVLSALQTRHWGDTRTLFRQTLRVNPRSLAALSIFAYDYNWEGNPEKALELYGQALEVNPGDPRVLYNIGNIYLAQNKPAEAAGAYRQALGQMDYNSNLHGNFGMVLAQLGHFDEAVFELNKAIQLNPRNAHARSNLGTILAARHDWAGARQQFEEALRVEPEQPAAREGLKQLESVGH
jgi:Flp pilus assembly protein TadD